MTALVLPPGPYLVLGCARAGTGAATALAARGGVVRAWDAYDGPESRAARDALAVHGVTVRLGPWDPALLAGVATVVKSPGIAWDHPAAAAARTRGATVVDELEIGSLLTSRPLLAVTGTDGKSTVCMLLAEALGTDDGPATVAGNTAFGPPLTLAAATGGPIVVETSSYQLEGCSGPFAALAVLTNLTEDHLHRHGTVDQYAAAKRRLFATGSRVVARAVLPAGSGYAHELAAVLRGAGSTVATFGTEPDAEYRVLDATWDARHGRVQLATPDGPLLLRTRLPGPHNAVNVAAAIAACDLYGVPRARAVAALEGATGVPGRWEHVDAGQDFAVVVDFAHTPAGLASALTTARSAVAGSGGRVHLVLSSGGGNDAGYRPALGAIAARLADRVLVTEGNGRGEPAANVIAAIRAGGPPHGRPLEAVPDRREAIRAAIGGAEAGDLVLVVDRGAMPRLLTNRAGGGPAFDDREVARAELLRRAATRPPEAAARRS